MLLSLYQGEGLEARRSAGTGGGEYSGPCPWCGGRDRFRVWPEQGESGRYWCRQCGKAGDSIQYLRERRGLSYREACEALGLEARTVTGLGRVASTPPAWEPRTCASPGELWQGKARRLISNGVFHLWGASGAKTRAYLQKDKGLAEATIKKFILGWLPADRWDQAGAWGLPAVLKEDGQPKKLWLPKGITIPWIDGGQVARVRVRRPEGEPRYYLLRGSSTAAMILGREKPVTLVLESELDALLMWQEAGDLVNVVALGNAQARPDRELAKVLQASRLILMGLDADPAGAKESWQWWPQHYPQAERWPPIDGKDPGEMLAAGVSVRLWVQAAFKRYGLTG